MHSKDIGEFQNQEAERAVIHSLIVDHKQTKIHIPDIHADFFFYPNFKEIFIAIRELSENGESVDIITIKKKIKNIKHTLTDVLSVSPLVSSLKTYIEILKDHADRRWFIHSCHQAIEAREKTPKIMSKLSVAISDRIRDRGRERTDMKSLIAEFEKHQDENRKHLASGKKYIGMPSGFATVDELINGIRKGHYWIINAYNNTGKSYFLLNVANRLLNQSKRVLYFSLEMSRPQNIARILGLKTRIDPTVIERGEEVLEAKAELYEQDLILYTQKRNINDIIVTVYAEQSIKPLDCIMIDYIQKIRGNSRESRYERYTNASDQLQKISQELQIPIIVASQIDNQSARSKSTDLVATKGSGDIANDVDFAILLQSSEEVGVIDCFIQKNRHGTKGGCKIKFHDGGNMYEEVNALAEL